MHTLLVNGGQAGLFLLGLVLIFWLERKSFSQRTYWTSVGAFCAVAAFLLFLVTFPVWIFGDFRGSYYVAGQIAWRGPGEAAALYNHGESFLLFVNMPIFSWLFAPFGLLPLKVAMAGITTLNILAALACWRLLVWLNDFDRRDSALTLLAISMFGPLLYNMREGNTSILILLVLLLCIAALRRGRDLTAGALIAFAVFMKPPLAIVAGYFVLRAKWRVVAAGLATAVTVTALSVLIFGYDVHVLWYESSIAPFLGSPVIASHSVETITAFVARLDIPWDQAIAKWTRVEITHAQEQLATAIKAVLLAVIAFAVVRSGRILTKRQDDMEAELYILFVLACMITATTWGHYYTWALPGFAYAYAKTRADAPAAALRIPLALSFVLATPVVFVSREMETGGFGPFWNVASSHLLFGAVLLIGVLAALRADFGARRATATPAAAAA